MAPLATVSARYSPGSKRPCLWVPGCSRLPACLSVLGLRRSNAVACDPWTWTDFFILVIGGMCAGAVVLNVPHLPTALAFLLSASLPVAFRLLATGSMADTALAAMIIVFAVPLSLAGAYLNRFFTEGLRLRIELNAANIRLRATMGEHRETEAALRQAQKLEAVGQLTGGRGTGCRPWRRAR